MSSGIRYAAIDVCVYFFHPIWKQLVPVLHGHQWSRSAKNQVPSLAAPVASDNTRYFQEIYLESLMNGFHGRSLVGHWAPALLQKIPYGSLQQHEGTIVVTNFLVDVVTKTAARRYWYLFVFGYRCWQQWSFVIGSHPNMGLELGIQIPPVGEFPECHQFPQHHRKSIDIRLGVVGLVQPDF